MSERFSHKFLRIENIWWINFILRVKLDYSFQMSHSKFIWLIKRTKVKYFFNTCNQEGYITHRLIQMRNDDSFHFHVTFHSVLDSIDRESHNT